MRFHVQVAMGLAVAFQCAAAAQAQDRPEFPPTKYLRHAAEVPLFTNRALGYEISPFLQTCGLPHAFRIEYHIEGSSNLDAVLLRNDSSHWRLEVRPSTLHLPWANAFPNNFLFTFRPRPIIPFLGELYAVEYAPGTGHGKMTRVTELAPAEVRPQVWSHIISLAELHREFLWNAEESLKSPGHAVYGRVKLISIQEDEERGGELCADVWLRPPHRRGPEGNFDVLQPDFEVRVHPGEILDTPNQSYRVINIVPEQEIFDGDESVGVLAGWIELDPEPLPPPSDPAVAPEEE